MAEKAIEQKLLAAMGEGTTVKVTDTSGGCGAMYDINVQSPKFKGLSLIKQHQLVNAILKEDIAQWHGVTMKTAAPKE